MNKRYLPLFLVLLLGTLSAACVQTPDQRQGTAGDDMLAQQSEEEDSLDERVRRVLGEAPRTMESGLDSELLYKLLLAEIAGQRGEIDLASETYLELVRASSDPRIAKRATEVALFARRDDIALESATTWHESDPESDAARRTLAELLVKSGDLRAARPLLAEMLASSPGGPEQTLMQLNDLCSQHPDQHAVYSLIRKLTGPYKELPEAQYALARAAYAIAMRPQALRWAERALKLRPGWEPGALLKSQVLRDDDPKKALAFMSEFLQEYPDAQEVRLNYARALVAEQRYNEARQEFGALLETNPNNANLAFTLGLLSAQIGEYENADKHFRKALSLGYGEPDAVYYQLGQVNERLERIDQAARWYRSVQGGEQFVAAQTRYALLLARRGGLDQARRYLHSLNVADDGQRVQLIQAEAHMLRELREYEQSFDVLHTALEERPDHRGLLYDVALAAERVDRLDVAENRLLELIALEPNSAQAYNALGYTLADRTERYDEAREYISKALALAPNDPFILDSMGWVEYRLGNYSSGIRYLRRAFEMQPDPEIAAHLGEVLWIRGRKEEAKRIWGDTFDRYPNNETLQQVMQKFLGR